MPAPSVVRVSDVSKRFLLHKHKSLKERIVSFSAARRHREDFWALRDVTLDIEIGSTVGLVGHNGSGKSTLLKVIGGIIEPTTGHVSRRGRMAALLELGAGFHPDLTGRENVYLNAAILGLNQKEIDRYFDSIVDFSGIEEFIDTQVKFYSSGMYVRLAFAVAVHVDPDLLLVDEVLAVGDEPFQRKCLDKIAEFQREGRSIVLVSHSSADVGRLCDRVVVMNHGHMMFDGPPADALRVLRFGYEEQRVHELRQRGEADVKDARISRIVLDSTDPIEHKTISPSADLELLFNYELLRDSGDLVAGIAIETSSGIPVYGVNTRALGLTIPTDAGAHTVRFRFPGHTLGTGQFAIRGSLELTDGQSLDRLNPASTFIVNPGTLGGGVINLAASASVDV